LNEVILPALAEQGIRFLRRSGWNEAQREWIREYFHREMVPVLTPIGLDPSHPFPRVLNKSLNFAIELEGKDAFGRSSNAAIVQAPRVLPRVIRLPEELAGCEYGFVFLSSILHEFVGELFTGMTVLGCYQFRATRNSDLFVDEEEVTNLRKLQGELPQRHFGNAVRLEVADNCSEAMTEFLLAQFGLKPADLYRVNGPVNLVRLMQVPDWVDRPDMKFRPSHPARRRRSARAPTFSTASARTTSCSTTPTSPSRRSSSFSARRRPTRSGGDQDDRLPHRHRLGADGIADPRRPERQGSHRRRRTDGAFRRGSQHQLGDQAGGGRRPRRVWRRRLQDPRQGAAHRAPRRRRPQALRPPRHRQLPPAHRPPLHRLRPDDRQRGNHRDVSEVFKQLTGLGQARTLKHLWQAPFTLHPNVVAGIQAEAEIARAGGKGASSPR
jgi:polyphosphate kinase